MCSRVFTVLSRANTQQIKVTIYVGHSITSHQEFSSWYCEIICVYWAKELRWSSICPDTGNRMSPFSTQQTKPLWAVTSQFWKTGTTGIKQR